MAAPAEPARLFTVGHLNHPIDRLLLALLRAHRVTAVADVRSSALSRHRYATGGC